MSDNGVYPVTGVAVTKTRRNFGESRRKKENDGGVEAHTFFGNRQKAAVGKVKYIKERKINVQHWKHKDNYRVE